MSNSEPRDASHYHNGFSNPAGRISELENMLEFAKEEIENFRGKWISEKRKAEQLQARVAELEAAASERCEAPVGWIPPNKYKSACESKMEFFKTVQQLRARVAELEADALRYRFLREQHWSDSSLCVVTTPKESVKPGRLCPSGELLDEAVDQAQRRRQQADEIEKAGGEQ